MIVSLQLLGNFFDSYTDIVHILTCILYRIKCAKNLKSIMDTKFYLIRQIFPKYQKNAKKTVKILNVIKKP